MFVVGILSRHVGDVTNVFLLCTLPVFMILHCTLLSLLQHKQWRIHYDCCNWISVTTHLKRNSESFCCGRTHFSSPSERNISSQIYCDAATFHGTANALQCEPNLTLVVLLANTVTNPGTTAAMKQQHPVMLLKLNSPIFVLIFCDVHCLLDKTSNKPSYCNQIYFASRATHPAISPHNKSWTKCSCCSRGIHREGRK
jgi:hypothetical protein